MKPFTPCLSPQFAGFLIVLGLAPSPLPAELVCVGEMMEMAKPVIALMNREFRPFTVPDLKALMRKPTIATKPDALAEAAEMVADWMKAIRSNAKSRVEVITVPNKKGDGQSAPYVCGQWIQDPKLPTVLLYAHLDVVDVKAENWRTDPFEPVEARGRIFGRGATDNKSGVIIFLAALRAMAAQGNFPVNIKFIVEAEEEIGSPNFATFAKLHPHKIKADSVLIADAGSRFKGRPTLMVSTRGGVVLDVKLSALQNGVHNGIFGGAAANPALGITHLLASLHDHRQNILVAGLAETALPITADDRTRMAEQNIDPGQVGRNAKMLPGVELAGNGQHPLFAIGRNAAIHYTPVVYSEPALTTIPASASTKILVRIPIGMEPGKTFELMKKHLQANVPLGMKLQVVDAGGGALPWSTPLDSPAILTASDIYSRVYGNRTTHLYNEGGGLPLLTIIEAINGKAAPVLIYGADEPGNNLHGNNESLSIEKLRKNVAATLYFMAALGQLPR